MNKQIPNASEMGKKGGAKLVETYGKDHMTKVGMKGNESMKKIAQDDPDFYRRRAIKIAEARRRNRELKQKQNSPLNKVVDLLSGK